MKLIARFFLSLVVVVVHTAFCIIINSFELRSRPWAPTDSNERVLISPSILSADFSRLGEEVRNVLIAGADVIHFDVMDNHFVPGLTVGPTVCRALRDYGITKDVDVHLMAQPVDTLIEDFAKAGSSYITIHPEGSSNLRRSLQLIRSLGCKAGLALSPHTSIDAYINVLDELDLILVMGVKPGLGGQTFIPSTLQKIASLRDVINKHRLNIRLSVDGGVNTGNIREIALAGADIIVAGSAIFKAPRTVESYKDTIDNMRAKLKDL